MSVIIAARNEEEYIAECLNALLKQNGSAGKVEVIVAANACTDRTVEEALSVRDAFVERGWVLKVVEAPEPGKCNAWNTGDSQASGSILVYLDADILCAPEMFEHLRNALTTSTPLYATGTLVVAEARTWITRQYSRFWQRLPFFQGGAAGAGLFAVNRPGRSRWATFPQIISDDTFVRLHFSPEERIQVPARYEWPMVEGLSNLIRVRKRQDEGVEEVETLFPALMRNDSKRNSGPASLLILFLKDPVGFLVYGLVSVAVRLRPSSGAWSRGR